MSNSLWKSSKCINVENDSASVTLWIARLNLLHNLISKLEGGKLPVRVNWCWSGWEVGQLEGGVFKMKVGVFQPPSVERKDSRLHTHTCRMGVTLGLMLTSCRLPRTVSLWTGVGTRGIAHPLGGELPIFWASGSSGNADTTPSPGEFKESEFGVGQTRVQILCLPLTNSITFWRNHLSSLSCFYL